MGEEGEGLEQRRRRSLGGGGGGGGGRGDAAAGGEDAVAEVGIGEGVVEERGGMAEYGRRRGVWGGHFTGRRICAAQLVVRTTYYVVVSEFRSVKITKSPLREERLFPLF